MRTKIKPRFTSYHRKKYILVIIICFGFLFLFFSFSFLIPRIELKGNAKITVNINDRYQEKGYQAFFLGKDISNEVKVEGNLNTEKEGTYVLYYNLEKYGFKIKAKRTVVVTDIKAPVITLKGEETAFICPKTTYQEEGYSAHDNVDGDVTQNVKVKKQKGKILYEVEDKKGNKGTAFRKIKEEDKASPNLTLTGGEVTFAYLNEPYLELGYQAYDLCDGDLTSSVKIEGEVDTSKKEDQRLLYKVEDKSGNITSKERLVRIVEHGEKGTIYLTFDDGPQAAITASILDILKEEGVKATFFVTGSGPDELIKRAYDEGHTIGLHTYSHNYGTVYSSVDSYFEDLQKVHDRVLNLTGYDSKIIRFPGGSSNTISRRYKDKIMTELTEEVLKRGYLYYDWNLTSGDAGELKTAEAIKENVINHLSKNRVNMILMHDTKPYTKDALRDIIRYGKENGYHFEAITPLTEMVRQRVNN